MDKIAKTRRDFDFMVKPEHSDRLWYVVESLVREDEVQEICGVEGSPMVYIRGRYPHADRRLVCPTCLAERMDNIREWSSQEYGKTYINTPTIGRK